MPTSSTKPAAKKTAPGKKERKPKQRPNQSQVGVANQTSVKNRYRKISFRTSAGPKDSIITHGTEFLGAVVLADSTVASGQVLSSVGLNPGAIAGTRLSLYSKMFEKYQIRHLKFHFESACPTTTPGNYVMFIDRDASDNIQESTGLVKQAYSSASMSTAHFWESSSLVYTTEDPQHFYYCNVNPQFDSTDRLNSPGNFRILASISCSSLPTSLGELWCEYEIHWYNPTVEEPIAGASSQTTTNTLQPAIPGAGLAGISPIVSGGITFSQDVDGKWTFKIPPTTAGDTNALNITEAMTGTNTGVPTNGVVDQLFIQPIINGQATQAVSLSDATILANMVQTFQGVGNSLNALADWFGVILPESLSQLPGFGSTVAPLFGVGNVNSVISFWRLYGTILAGYSAAATRIFAITSGPTYRP